ncbi:MAG: hypothetical protein IJZ80_05810 [Clostridia bacterium]|nr:hypothetical protein [Clostridia bacterium]
MKENGVVFEKRIYEKQIVAFQNISVSFLCYCAVLTGTEKYAILSLKQRGNGGALSYYEKVFCAFAYNYFGVFFSFMRQGGYDIINLQIAKRKPFHGIVG